MYNKNNKSSSIRIPVYGIFLQICAILLGSLMISSCMNFRTEVKPPAKTYFPNVIEDMSKIMLANNDNSMEYLRKIVDQEVNEGARRLK